MFCPNLPKNVDPFVLKIDFYRANVSLAERRASAVCGVQKGVDSNLDLEYSRGRNVSHFSHVLIKTLFGQMSVKIKHNFQ